jgi:hypothetical protein
MCGVSHSKNEISPQAPFAMIEGCKGWRDGDTFTVE